MDKSRDNPLPADKNTGHNKADLQKILDGLARAATGDLVHQIQVSGTDQELAAVALGLNNLLKGIRITADESRDAQKQLEIRAKKLAMIYESSPDIVLLVNKYGTIVDINRRVKKILGYDPEDLKGRHFAKVEGIPEDILSELIEAFKDAAADGPVQVHRDVQILTKNGNARIMEVGTAMLRNDTTDEIEGAVVVLRDVTIRRQMETGLRDQLRQLHLVLSSMEELVFILDKDLRFTAYFQAADLPTPSALTMPQDYLGKTIRDVFPKEIAQDLDKAVRACQKTKRSQKIDFPWKNPAAEFWFNARIAALTDDEGEVNSVIVVIREITRRKQMEQALEASEKKYRKIFENSPQGFILLDTEGRIVDVNKKICNWLGHKRDDLIGKDHVLWPFLTKTGKVTAMKKFYQRLTGKVVPAYDLEFVTKSGEVFLGEVLAMQIRDDEGRITQVLAMITDVTDRHTAAQ